MAEKVDPFSSMTVLSGPPPGSRFLVMALSILVLMTLQG
jgi:hypothetical protein